MPTPAKKRSKAVRTPPIITKSQGKYLQRLTIRAETALKIRMRKLKRKIAKNRTMVSFTNPEKHYTVSLTSCTCPDYKFRRRSRGDICKHMKKMRSKLVCESVSKKADPVVEPRKR